MSSKKSTLNVLIATVIATSILSGCDFLKRLCNQSAAEKAPVAGATPAAGEKSAAGTAPSPTG
ncbi:hypothetical protein [Candidatus Liberibacter americanus]|uniref:Uncharacterized protein n=1 Tax=Candidatus Liberibacter americanus str. Sao Paulo TaxID=1261131 RepID=U6B7U9_9HYPH|nr:hypothetical protein [Candidatus Liberibacter americanus]AHA27936.1 hypothetical protein lam_589 [Candidatus Liberibacter americanus str. Sao Paulo]EMS35833.1 hypothetical protein G653_04601 [Candidatus Liberibacter americanus PW_SP]